jgi:geranylgeranyl diphosphate synthase type I
VQFSDLALYRPRIERILLDTYRRERRTCPPSVRSVLDLSRDLTLRGGKRFRALLLLAGYYVATARSPTPVLEAAAALEHFQSWMLIHDDVIDHSEERRGGPTVHRAAARLHEQEGLHGSSEDFGIGTAVTLGDLEEPLTIEGFLRTKVPGVRQHRALVEYGRMTRFTAYGQLLDIRNGLRDPGAVTELEVLRVHELKSAVYTVVAPLKMGAILGGARPSSLEALAAFGTDLGIAFQLRDDVLGAGFDAEGIGKSSNDLSEGKRTLLVVRAWAQATPPDRERFARVLGNPTAPEEEVERAREILRSTGSLEYSERMIQRLAKRGLSRMERSGSIRTEAKPLLREIAAKLVERRT